VKKCLLIDDDHDDEEIFGLALQRLPEPVDYKFVDGADRAIELLRAGDWLPDYIFLDLNMPRISGTECLAMIKSMPALAHIPVIICSTSTNPLYEETVKELNANHYLVKPTQISQLAEILSDLMINQRQLPFTLNPN
jgi:CheY-like chemotaxis protein